MNLAETNCKLVSSMGIRNIAEQIPGVIYVRNHKIPKFVIPTEPFVLVTGDSDMTIDLTVPNVTSLLNSTFLIHWFSQNLGLSHPKCTHIPIGLDYHSLSPNSFNEGASWWGKKSYPLMQESQLLGIKQTSSISKIPKIYCNFTHALYLPERANCLRSIKHSLIHYEKTQVPRITTWTNMTKYKFVLSPPGVGLDCHRTWEALVLGCIPIIRSSPIDSVYKDLPVWIVKDWSEANNLENCPICPVGSNFDHEKLNLEYWISLINNHAKYIIQNP